MSERTFNPRKPKSLLARAETFPKHFVIRKSGSKKTRSAIPVLPTLLTLGNAVCGLGSITLSTWAGYEAARGDLIFLAGLLVFCGMLFDMLDGHAARVLKQTSDFGTQLDSLCDVITFGVAPVFIMLVFSDYYHIRLLWAIGTLFTLCTVLRLARFNVSTDQLDSHTSFCGLPSPAAAGTIASFAIAMPALRGLTTDESMPATTQRVAEQSIAVVMILMPVLTFFLASLMVSRVTYPHVFNQFFRGHRTFFHLVQLIFALAAILTVHELALPLIFCFFVFGRPTSRLWQKLTGRSTKVTPTPAISETPA